MMVLRRMPRQARPKHTMLLKRFNFERHQGTSVQGEGTCLHDNTNRPGDRKTSDVNEARTPDDSLGNALPFSQMPGPGGLKKIPYIGALFLFKPFTKYSVETFGQLACDMHSKYGMVFRARLGKNYTVHTCNVEDIQRIFSQEPKHPLRRLMDLSRVYRERNNLPQGLTSCSGEEWHSLRKPLNLVLKRRKAVFSYVPSLDKVAEVFAQRLLEVEGEDITSKAEEMNKLFFRFGSESVGVVCFNERLGFLDPEFDQCPEKKKLLAAFRTSVSCTFKAISGVERRYLKTDKDKFYQLYQSNMAFIRQQSASYVENVLRVCKTSSSFSSTNPNEESSTLIHHGEDEDNNLLLSLLRRQDLSMDRILANIESMLIAGSDSTARVLSVLLYDMARHPDIQQCVAEEVHRYAGKNGPITEDIVDKLRLAKACVKESMRVHYPVSSGVERILTKDTAISGYRVPAGTSVIMTGVRTSKDPTYFTDPLAFKPERWFKDRPGLKTRVQAGQSEKKLESESSEPTAAASSLTESRLSGFAFIPFGHGARSCVGSRFAQMELLVGLARIIQKLHVSVHCSYGDLNVHYTPFITPMKPIPFIFKKR